MGRWSRDEIESAFERHKQVVVEIGSSWDWSRFADQFTEDATYVEHTYGTFQRPRADPRLDCVDDECFPRQRDAAISDVLVLH